MARVVGIDAGTVSLDVCGLDGGRLWLDATVPTREALADPEGLIDQLCVGGRPDCVVIPSGYGLPLQAASDVSEDDLRLAFLSAAGDEGGIGGLRRFARSLGSSGLPAWYLPGVIHLDTVPRHRKFNRVDLGTSDKVCGAALAIHDQAIRRGVSPSEVSLILLELGGAFTAGTAVRHGQIVDGIGGTSGPLGWQSSGALDGEVAFLAGSITKHALFQGGVETIGDRDPAMHAAALEAYAEGAARMVAHLRASAPEADEILLSGRRAAEPGVLERVLAHLETDLHLRPLDGFAVSAKQGAQGAALIADGLAGGGQREMVERLRLREASGSVLDHLYVISPEAARARLGVSSRA